MRWCGRLKDSDVARKKKKSKLTSKPSAKSEEVIHFSSSKSMLANIPRSIFEHLHNLLIFKIMEKKKSPSPKWEENRRRRCQKLVWKSSQINNTSIHRTAFLPRASFPFNSHESLTRENILRSFLREPPVSEATARGGQIENARRRKSSHARLRSAVPG